MCDVKICEVGWFGGSGIDSISIFDNGVWLALASGGKDGFFDFESLGVANKFLPGAGKDKIWRHIAFQLDEVDDKVRFYLDGALVLESDIWEDLGAVKDFDVSEGLMEIFGEYSSDLKGSVADVRLYVHDESDGLLTPAEIKSIAEADDTAGLAATVKCLKHESEKLEDKRWKDKMGHDCQVSVYSFSSSAS